MFSSSNRALTRTLLRACRRRQKQFTERAPDASAESYALGHSSGKSLMQAPPPPPMTGSGLMDSMPGPPPDGAAAAYGGGGGGGGGGMFANGGGMPASGGDLMAGPPANAVSAYGSGAPPAMMAPASAPMQQIYTPPAQVYTQAQPEQGYGGGMGGGMGGGYDGGSTGGGMGGGMGGMDAAGSGGAEDQGWGGGGNEFGMDAGGGGAPAGKPVDMAKAEIMAAVVRRALWSVWLDGKL